MASQHITEPSAPLYNEFVEKINKSEALAAAGLPFVTEKIPFSLESKKGKEIDTTHLGSYLPTPAEYAIGKLWAAPKVRGGIGKKDQVVQEIWTQMIQENRAEFEAIIALNALYLECFVDIRLGDILQQCFNKLVPAEIKILTDMVEEKRPNLAELQRIRYVALDYMYAKRIVPLCKRKTNSSEFLS